MAAHTVQSLRYKASISVGDLFLFLQDYDFELDSGLRRGAGHTTSVACMVGHHHLVHKYLCHFVQVILSVVAMMWVGCARMARNRRFGIILSRGSFITILL